MATAVEAAVDPMQVAAQLYGCVLSTGAAFDVIKRSF